jgi:hypothetical protein
MIVRHQWPKEGISRIPFWVYTDPEIYAREQERIFCGRSWAYVALEAAIPTPFETLRDELTRVFSVGRCHDKLTVVDGRLKFKEKLVIFDSELIPNSLIYPL